MKKEIKIGIVSVVILLLAWAGIRFLSGLDVLGRSCTYTAHYEQVKRFTLLPEPFSMQRGELTNTLKIKRSVLNVNYKQQIDAMYQE